MQMALWRWALTSQSTGTEACMTHCPHVWWQEIWMHCMNRLRTGSRCSNLQCCVNIYIQMRPAGAAWRHSAHTVGETLNLSCHDLVMKVRYCTFSCRAFGALHGLSVLCKCTFGADICECHPTVTGDAARCIQWWRLPKRHMQEPWGSQQDAAGPELILKTQMNLQHT